MYQDSLDGRDVLGCMAASSEEVFDHGKWNLVVRNVRTQYIVRRRYPPRTGVGIRGGSARALAYARTETHSRESPGDAAVPRLARGVQGQQPQAALEQFSAASRDRPPATAGPPTFLATFFVQAFHSLSPKVYTIQKSCVRLYRLPNWESRVSRPIKAAASSLRRCTGCCGEVS